MNPVGFTMLVEAVLVAVTLVLLVQPSIILGQIRSPKSQSLLTNTGLITLCLTFCWSFVLGCILTLSGFEVRIF